MLIRLGARPHLVLRRCAELAPGALEGEVDQRRLRLLIGKGGEAGRRMLYQLEPAPSKALYVSTERIRWHATGATHSIACF